MITNNNKSRKLFAKFLEEYGFKRIDSRNVFMDNKGKIGAFALCSSKKEIFCRQFYEDCDYLTVQIKNDFFDYSKKELIVSETPSRISPKGKKAFNARVAA